MGLKRILLGKISVKTLTIIFLLLFFGTSGISQTHHKQQYSSELDSLWSKGTYIFKLTNNGQWMVFMEEFSNRKTVWVSQTRGSKKFGLPESEWLDFSRNSKWFGCISNENEMILINLENQTEERYSNIVSYSFSSDGTYIAALQGLGEEKELILIDPKTKIVERSLKNVTNYVWHPSKNILLATYKESEQLQVIRYDVGRGNIKQLFTETEGRIEHLGWNETGLAAVFLNEKKNGNRLYFHNEAIDSLKILSDVQIHHKFKKYQISARKPYVSADGNKILFYLQPIKKTEDTVVSTVEIWDAEDPWIEPKMAKYREREEQYVLAAWYPKSGEIKVIETEDLPTAAMSVNHDYALLFNELQYEPLYKYYPNADLYVKNIKTGDSTLVCKNQYTEGKFVTISPNGKYISYFKDTDWWVYNIASGKNINLTEGLQGNFENTELQNAGDIFPYGNPGWSEQDEYIVLYDQYDIWMISPNGKTKKRITQGKEERTRYRILLEDGRKKYEFIAINPNFSSSPLELEKGLVLELFDYNNYNTGLALWTQDSEIKPIVMVEGKIAQAFIDKDLEILVYTRHRFDKPISLNSIDLKTKKTSLIYQTNEGLLEYDMGSAEFIEYELEGGKKLRGSLIYPANYKQGKKYPMIVEIYEKESMEINNFEPPSNLMLDGFNLLKFTMNDYFVLFPDIDYTIGEPGISSLKSVTAAVKKVLEAGQVDEGRIGLIGHSFGGYETAFIISQTDMFAAGVAGSPVTDVVNYYHDVAWTMKFSQMWRMENQQFRFGHSFYKMKEAYISNSPLHQVENITTPLLLWTGKTDTNVNWSQSINMFLALKRLGKKSKLLLYEGEGHNIFKPKNQNNLSLNIFDWMETLVKNKKELKSVSRSIESGYRR